MRLNTRSLIVTLALASGLHATAAHADEGTLPGSEQLGWEVGGERLTVSIAPFYAWFPGFQGNVRALGAPANIDISPWDVIRNLDNFLDALDTAYIGAGEVQYGDFGLFYDVFFVDYLEGTTIERGIFSLDVDVAFRKTLAKVAATYRVVETEQGVLDAMAGINYYDIDLSVGLTLNGIISDNLREDQTWVDPIIGAKGRYALSPNWSFQGWGVLGGFGVNSDIIAEGFGTLSYDAWDRVDLWAGYRASYVDFASGGFEWNVVSHGPVLGFNVNF